MLIIIRWLYNGDADAFYISLVVTIMPDLIFGLYVLLGWVAVLAWTLVYVTKPADGFAVSIFVV